jgi:hypothetical protein
MSVDLVCVVEELNEACSDRKFGCKYDHVSFHRSSATTEGAALAYEFAKCEDARLLLSNDKINKLRILERTLLTFFDSDFNMSVAQLFNLLIVYMAVFFFFFTNKKLGGIRLEREEYSRRCANGTGSSGRGCWRSGLIRRRSRGR